MLTQQFFDCQQYESDCQPVHEKQFHDDELDERIWTPPEEKEDIPYENYDENPVAKTCPVRLEA